MPPTTEQSVARLKQLEKLLDRQFNVAGINFGIDSVIGLVPVVGDLLTGALGFYLISEARKLGVSRWALTQMYSNLGIDVTIGAIPIVGDVFDLAFKSNSKNLKLLLRDVEKREAKVLRRTSRAQRLKTS